MRGTRKRADDRRGRHGIIPADAGNTPRMTGPSVRTADHPRGCGEHLRNHHHGESSRGSSPRMRGTHAEDAHIRRLFRIIPADAGNTQGRHRLRSWIPDHPRGCGEHSGLIAKSGPTKGSSPRMRGTPKREIENHRRVRIIPADAGNTAGAYGRDG